MNTHTTPEDAARTLRVLGVRFTIEDDGNGDSFVVYSEVDDHGCPVAHSDDLYTYDPEDGHTVAQWAARILRDHGATQDVGSWWSDPDGSFTADYGTGEREETSAHPEGFTPDEMAAIGVELEA